MLPDLPLFSGPHVPAVRFEAALGRLDFVAARQDCPPEWAPAFEALAAAARRRALEPLVAARTPGWPDAMERAWNLLVGRRLDGPEPRRFDGELAAAYLLRGGDPDAASRSIDRHLWRHPADPAGWQLAVRFRGAAAAARLAFHGGAQLPELAPLLDAMQEDDVEPPARWALAYAWLCAWIAAAEVGEALRAAGVTERPIPLPGDGIAFAWYIEEAERERAAADGLHPEVVEARRRLRLVQPRAFARYLARVTR